jgi:hypothetical protein
MDGVPVFLERTPHELESLGKTGKSGRREQAAHEQDLDPEVATLRQQRACTAPDLRPIARLQARDLTTVRTALILVFGLGSRFELAEGGLITKLGAAGGIGRDGLQELLKVLRQCHNRLHVSLSPAPVEHRAWRGDVGP